MIKLDNQMNVYVHYLSKIKIEYFLKKIKKEDLTIFKSFPVYESNFNNLKFVVATNNCLLGAKRTNKAASVVVIDRRSFVINEQLLISILNVWFKLFVSTIVTINSVGPT